MKIGWQGHLVTGAVVVAIATWLGAFDLREPITFGEATITPDSGVPNGRVMTYYRVDVKRPDCIFFVSRAVEDASGVLFPSTAIRMERRPAGPQQLGFAMVIPMDAVDGPLHMRNSMYWACSAWQQLFHPEHPLPGLTVTVHRP